MGRPYLTDYTVAYIDGKKKRVYRGPLFHIHMDDRALKKAKARLTLNALALIGLFILMGIAGSDATRTVYVGLPYALMVIPVGFIGVDMFKFCLCGVDMERMQYEGSFLHMLIWAVLVMIFCVALVIGGTIFLIRSTGTPAREYGFIPLAAAAFALVYTFFMQLRRVKSNITTVDPPPSDSLDGHLDEIS